MNRADRPNHEFHEAHELPVRRFVGFVRFVVRRAP
jgi:hypothetical protein